LALAIFFCIEVLVSKKKKCMFDPFSVILNVILVFLLCLLMIKLLRCSAIGDFSAVDMAYALTNGAGNFEVTPESLRSVLPLINWDKISAMYLPGRSGAECESRYTFLSSCSQHALSLSLQITLLFAYNVFL
jgi:hypothetical protein